MNHTLFTAVFPTAHCQQCNLFQSWLTHTHRLYPAMISSKYRWSLIGRKSAPSLLPSLTSFQWQRALFPRHKQLFCSSETCADLIQHTASKTKLSPSSTLTLASLFILAVWLNDTTQILSTPGLISQPPLWFPWILRKGLSSFDRCQSRPKVEAISVFCYWRQKK